MKEYKTVGILSALDVESEIILRKMTDKEVSVFAGMTFTRGLLMGKDVVLATCGVSKVNAALFTQIMIDRFSPDCILFTGVVSTGWEEVLKEVNENEIPLILLDRIPDCADKIDYVAAFGGDFPLEGRRQVQWAGEYLKSLGRDSETVNVAIMEGTTGADAQVGRTEGNLAALEDYPFMEVVAQQTGNFTRAEGQALMETWLKSVDKIDVLIAQNDDMALGAIDAIKAAAAGLVPGEDIIIVGCDSVKAAFEAIVAGEMNATIECNPLYGEFVVNCIEALESGETFDKEVIHPEEGVYDCVGGIEVEGTTSVLASDVIDERQY